MAKVRIVLKEANYVRGGSEVGSSHEVDEAEANLLVNAGVADYDEAAVKQTKELEGQIQELREASKENQGLKNELVFVRSELEGAKAQAADLEAQVEQLRATLERKDARIKELEEAASSTPLPEDFPARAELAAGGYSTVEKVKGLKKGDLTKLEGVGEATANKVVEAASRL